MTTRTHCLSPVVLAAMLVATPVAAQEGEPAAASPAQELERLLAEIRKLPAAAWKARIDELRSEIEAHRKAAAELRAEAMKLKERADRETAKSNGLEKEIERLESLMALVRPPAAGAGAAEAKTETPAAMPDPAPMPKAQPDKAESAAMPKDIEVRAVSFVEHVEPILDESCMVCHDEVEASGGLDLSSYAALMEGGSSGETVVSGDPDKSRLYRLVAHLEKPTMPKDGEKLARAEIETIRHWIALGAPETADAAKAAAARMAAERAAATADAESAPAAPRFSGPPPMPTSLPAVALAPVTQPPSIKTLAASPRAPLVALSGHRQILLQHAERRELLGVLPFPLGDVEVIRFSRDGARLLAAGSPPGKRGGAVVYDVESGEIVAQVGRERGTVLAADVSPDGTRVALGGAGKVVRVYDTASGQLVYELDAHDDFILGVDFSPDGAHFATVDRSGSLCIWEAPTGRNSHVLRPKAGALNDVRFRPDGTAVAVAAHDGSVRVYDVTEGEQSWKAKHGAAVLALAWSPDGTLASSGEDGRLRVWQPGDKDLGRSPPLGEWVYAIAFSHDGARLWAGDWAGRLHALDAEANSVASTTVPSTNAIE